jgi:hypothetical protein
MRKNILLWPLIRHFNISTTFYLLTIINSIHVDLIYPNELEIKDTTECSTSASYLDILLKLDTNGKMTTQLNDKRNDFNFSLTYVVIGSYIPASPAYGWYISQLIRYASWWNFRLRQSICTVSFTDSFPQILWSLQRSNLPVQPFFGPYDVWYVSYQSISRF